MAWQAAPGLIAFARFSAHIEAAERDHIRIMAQNDIQRPVAIRSTAPLDRAQKLSEALADAARRARFSSRSRRLVKGGFSARRGQTLFYWFAMFSFWLLVALPTVAGIAYFGFYASDQYVAEFKFTVAGSELPVTDRIGAMTGIPAMSIVQDTQIVVNHLTSRAAVESIEKKINLREHYSAGSVDYFARFDADKPIEKFLRYWKSMAKATIQMPSGIVDVQIRAFSPEAVKAIADAAVEVSETLINEMNARMNRDALDLAETEVKRTGDRLSLARVNLQRARNDAGYLDVIRAAEGINKLLTETRSGLMLLQQEYQANLRSVSAEAPQMQNLRARINATQQQIRELEAQLTQSTAGSGLNDTLSKAMTRFSELELEREIAEKHYGNAIASLELARINAERKKMYLNTFVRPTVPQEAKFPRRVLMIFLTALGALCLWGAIVGTANAIRNHMA
jgi:capsular polysaccharide transport system permease protein